ncbi:hypothetical protein Bca4012_057955 [Brassica carinata]
MADNTDNRRAIWGVPEKLQLHIAMLTLQFGYAGFHVVSRAALNMGISKLVFPVYRNIIALLLLLPFAFFLEKIEKVRINRRDGISKVLGTALCVAGASVITLYKGPTIYTPTSNLHAHLLTTNSAASAVLAPLGDAAPKNWTLGCIYLIGHCLSWSGWLVFQAPVLKSYPARLSVTSYTLLFGIIQFVIIAAFCERDSQAWVFHSGWELFTILYAGIVASGIAFAVQIWCIDRGGPVFVAVYQPVQTLVVAIMASIALGEEFYLGGIIGAVLIIAGLYFVLYGKSEERKFAALEKAEIQSSAEHGIERAPNSRGSITAPLLHQSTNNV